MSLLVVGTVPVDSGRVFLGPVAWDGGSEFTVGAERLPTCQGCAAMLLAALAATRSTGAEPPVALLGGDIGRGDGTRAVYVRLPELADTLGPDVVAFHYLQPVMALMRAAVEALAPEGTGSGRRLVADAGGMYAARAAGLAPRFELMTPDVGEVGFLADGSASHPAYVSRYLFGNDDFDPAELVRLAWERGGSARVLLVKGAQDLIAEEGRPVATVGAPDVPELEAIGGTGDTITGLAAGLMSGGMDTVAAAERAARANRLAGALLGARPDHRASDLAARFPEVLDHLAAETARAGAAS